MEELKKAVAYIRVSTDAQAGEDRYGADAQRRAIEDYALKNGYAIERWCEEVGSGAKERPVLDRLVFSETTNPPYEAVIVYKNDRVARDTKLYFYYLYSLEKKGVKLLSVSEEFAEGNELSNVMKALLQFVAEQERKNITRRTSSGRRAKADMGGYSGGSAPYGYYSSDGALVVDETKRKAIVSLFRMRDEGLGYLAIANAMTDAGYPTPSTSQRWSAPTIRNIIERRKFYEGQYQYGDGEWVKGQHEAILRA